MTDNTDRRKKEIKNRSLICIKCYLLQDGSYGNCFAKSRFLSQDTKTMGCPAKIAICDIVHFTGYKVEFYIFDIYLLLIRVK